MTKLKHLRTRLDQMTMQTYTLLRGALLLATTIALCALALLYTGGGDSMTAFEAQKIAQELMSLSTMTLLIAAFASIAVEELTSKNK